MNEAMPVLEVVVTGGMTVEVAIEFIEASLSGYKSINDGSISSGRRASETAKEVMLLKLSLKC